MKIALLTNIVSPHQIPLAREIAKRIGAENYRYIHTEPFEVERAKMGWKVDGDKFILSRENPEAEKWLENADLVYSEERDIALFKKRSAKGLKTFYVSERWFKPIIVSRFGMTVYLPGKLKMLSPGYRNMAKAIVELLKTDKNFYYFPQGVHAAADMAWLMGKRVKEEAKYRKWEPGDRCFGEEKLRMWGYFVEKGLGVRSQESGVLKVLWVGRMIPLKKVDTIIKAVSLLKNDVELTLVGNGPCRSSLQKLASGLPVKFLDSVPINEVRNLMRQQDVYVFSSNSFDGWGAVVSEALEEGLRVIGTREAGATATILPKERLYCAGDWHSLARLLKSEKAKELPACTIGKWTAKDAAEYMVRFAEGGLA